MAPRCLCSISVFFLPSHFLSHFSMAAVTGTLQSGLSHDIQLLQDTMDALNTRLDQLATITPAAVYRMDLHIMKLCRWNTSRIRLMACPADSIICRRNLSQFMGPDQ